MQADLKQRAFEIEKKTKEVDLLNRKYEKLQSSQQGGPEAGTFLPLPLPCIIKTLEITEQNLLCPQHKQ